MILTSNAGEEVVEICFNAVPLCSAYTPALLASLAYVKLSLINNTSQDRQPASMARDPASRDDFNSHASFGLSALFFMFIFFLFYLFLFSTLYAVLLLGAMFRCPVG